MKIPEMNKVYVLNPHYHLRHDIHRVALFSSTGTDTDCSRNWHTFIHPLQRSVIREKTQHDSLQRVNKSMPVPGAVGICPRTGE